METIIKRQTGDFLNSEVKDFALYVIKSRSLPSIMDGMRIGARKITYSAMTGDLRKVKKDKMPSLIGDTMKMKFHHGDAALKNTIEQLSSEHIFRYCPLTVIGQIGTLRNPETSTAARYLEVAKRKYLEWFNMDSELFELNFEEGKFTEPKFFLPLIPITLLWRTNSPGFGFSFRSFSYDLDDIIDATMQSIINGSCSGLNYVQLKPEVFGIKPENLIFNENKNSWYNVGEYIVDNDTLIITELPYNVTTKKYREHLIALKDANYIVDFQEYEDESKKASKGTRKSKADKKINRIHIKFSRGRLQTLLNSEKFAFFGKMKLYSKIPDDTLNTIDIDGKSIVRFENPNDLVDGFVKRRLMFYDKRKTRLINVIQENIDDLEDKQKFLELYISGELKVIKRSIVDIKKDCDKLGVSYEGLKLPLMRLSQDELDKTKREIQEKYDYLHYIKNTTIKQMYIKDLIDFKAEYSPKGIMQSI